MQTTTTGTGMGSSVATDETNRLIASDKVEGTAVYNRQGERLGSVYNFMVDKRSGQVEYAVLSFGGFLGIGEDYYPLPWKALTYDPSQGGYVVDLDKDRLRDAPNYAASDNPDWRDPDYGRRIDDYYGPFYPGI
jgi:sporulation protein YlmC with PRC-barrel domain